MAHFWQNLRDGAWLTRERIRAYALIVLGLWLAVSVVWLALSPGLIDPNGKPIGTTSQASTPQGRWRSKAALPTPMTWRCTTPGRNTCSARIRLTTAGCIRRSS